MRGVDVVEEGKKREIHREKEMGRKETEERIVMKLKEESSWGTSAGDRGKAAPPPFRMGYMCRVARDAMTGAL